MINILYTSDDAYCPYMGISLLSLLRSNSREMVRLYNVLLDPSEDNICRLRKMVETFPNCELHIIDGTPYVEQMKQFGIIQYRKSYAPNLRLFFEQYVDEDVERLLYLDSDIIVKDSLAPLFEMPMDGCVGVVLDSLAGSYKKRLGFAREDPYFNSGVLLIDVTRWKAQNMTAKLFELIRDPEYIHANPDQDYLNQLLRGNIMILSPRYNLQPHHMCLDAKTYFFNYEREHYYSETELQEALDAPVILHTYRFLGNFPWHSGNLHPAREEYQYYKRLSPWAELPDEPANPGFLFRAENFCWKHLPRGMFFDVWCFFQRIWFRQHDRKVRRVARENL